MSIKKVVVIGPESTGKSTLSRQLADTFETLWVPENARDYLLQLDRPYAEDDLVIIAKGQVASEDELAVKANKLLICDTDLNVIKVWSEHKYHRCNKYIYDQIKNRKYDLYLLTGIDMPWESDPLREHPDAVMRQHFYNTYHDIVKLSAIPWVAINGDRNQRLAAAIDAIIAMKTD